MSGSTTTYDVQLRYLMDDQASRGASHLGSALADAHKQGQSLTSTLAGVGAAAASYLGFHQAYKSLVDYNSEIEQMKISLTAILSLDVGGTFAENQTKAAGLFDEFQKFSKTAPVTTKQVMEFGNSVSAAVFGAGGNMKDFIEITEKGIIASKVFGGGRNAAYAALEMQELLSGNVNKRMQFAMQVLHAAHVSEEAFKAMKGQERISVIRGVLGSDAMKEANKAFGESFTGVTSTLVDNIEILLGKVGLPIFKAISAEIGRWNEWIEKNNTAIEGFATKFGQALVDGFQSIKSIFSWIVDHADLLMAIGKVWLMSKVAGGMGAMGGMGGEAGGLGGGLLGIAGQAGMRGLLMNQLTAGADTFTRTTATVSGALSAIPGPIGMFGQALSIGIGVIESFFGYLNSQIDAKNKATVEAKYGEFEKTYIKQYVGDFQLAREQLDKYGNANHSMDLAPQVMKFLKEAQEAGALTRNETGDMTKGTYALDMAAVKEYLTRSSTLTAAEQGAQAEMIRIAFKMMVSNADLVEAMNAKFSAAGPMLEPGATGQAPMPVSGKPQVNVTINKIEVQSDDPDRFVFGMVEAFSDAARNPSSAHSIGRGGG
jgi:hypothetical protein